MRVARGAIAGTISALVLIVVVAGVRTLVSVKQGVRRPDNDWSESIAGDNDGPPFFLVSYDDAIVTDPDQRRLYAKMAHTLNGSRHVPKDRLNYYSAVNHRNGYAVTGWQAVITDVQANRSGHVVTVFVNPTLTNDDAGSLCVIMTSDYSEQYQINNDHSFQYLGYLDPQGLAGQLPGDIASL